MKLNTVEVTYSRLCKKLRVLDLPWYRKGVLYTSEKISFLNFRVYICGETRGVEKTSSSLSYLYKFKRCIFHFHQSYSVFLYYSD